MLDPLRTAWKGVRGLAPGTGPESAGVRALLWTVLIAALIARCLEAHEGLPYVHSWDEPNVTGRALDMMKTGNLNPDFFVYGTLPIYMDVVTDVIHYLWLMARPATSPPFLTDLDEIQTGFDTGWLWHISHPSFYLWNRWLSAIFGTATALLTYLIGRRIAGRWGGIAAAAFLAGTIFHVKHSAIGTVDGAMTFFVVLAAWGATAFVQEGRPGLILASLVACGLAASTKLTAGVALCMPVAALTLAGRRLPPLPRRLAWLGVPALPAAAFLAGSPYVLLNLRQFLIDVGQVTRINEVGPRGHSAIDPGLGHLLFQLGTMAANVGWFAVPFILVGLVALAARRQGMVLVLYGAAHAIFVAQTRVSHHRNLLVLYPLAAVAFGAGVVVICRGLAGLSGRASPFARHAATAAAILVSIFLAWGQVSALAAGARSWRTPESRSRALDLANTLTADGAGGGVRLAVPEEMRIHPDDLARLAVPHDVRPWPSLVCHEDEYTHFLRPWGWSNYSPHERRWRELYERLEPREGKVVADTGGQTPLTLDVLSVNPTIEIVELGAPGARPGSSCLGSFTADDLDAVSPHRAGPEGELMVMNDAPVETPWMLSEPGSYAVVIKGQGTAALGEQARIRVAVHVDGWQGPPAAEKEIDLGDSPEILVLSFELKEDAPLGVRMQLVNDFFSAATGEDRNAFVSWVWVISTAGRSGNAE